MTIRKYKPEDYDTVVHICLHNADLEDHSSPIGQFIYEMFCRYYIECEPENCFVAVDDNDVPFGYVYGAADYDRYEQNFKEYLCRIREIGGGKYLADAQVEMYNHLIYKDTYPAHLHIDLLENGRGSGVGTSLIKHYCENIKSRGINGVMLIVGSDNYRGRNFYEKNGFTLLADKESGAAYGKKL